MIKTVVYPSPGELELVERPLPQAAAGEVLLRQRHLRGAAPYGLAQAGAA